MLLLAAISLATAAQTGRTPLIEADRQIIRAAVGDRLLDGPTARFRWPAEDRAGVTYCGFVNGRNRLGAYTGFVPFAAIGGHLDGPRGNHRWRVERVTIATDNPGDVDSQIVATLCARAGFDLQRMPAGD